MIISKHSRKCIWYTPKTVNNYPLIIQCCLSGCDICIQHGFSKRSNLKTGVRIFHDNQKNCRCQPFYVYQQIKIVTTSTFKCQLVKVYQLFTISYTYQNNLNIPPTDCHMIKWGVQPNHIIRYIRRTNCSAATD